MSQDQSPAVIDATDAHVLPPAGASAELSVQQSYQLERCSFNLLSVGRKIAAREIGLIYLYVEAGWWLLKARAAHHVEVTSTRSEGRFVAHEESGFLRWLEAQNLGVSDRTARAWMQGARNAGLTEESTIFALRAIKDENRLAGRTLTDICRKPVDKDDQQADLHEVTDEEQAALDEEERNAFWDGIMAQLHERGVEKDEWAKLDPERRAGTCDLLSELVKRIKPSLRKGKPALPVPALPQPAPETKPHPWRVGQRTGQTRWQIKQAPGWKVVHEVDAIEQAVAWLRNQGVSESDVDVLTVTPWPSLDKFLVANPAVAKAADRELNGDPECTQEAMGRGLWWFGWTGFRDQIVVKTFHGDMKEIIEGRSHPRVGKTFIGPFYAETLGDAEKIVRERNVDAKI